VSHTKFAAAWNKGDTGLEVSFWSDESVTPETPEIINLCHDTEVMSLLAFVQQRWPEEFASWLKWHPEAKTGDVTDQIPQAMLPEAMRIRAPEKLVTVQSRTGGNPHHVVHQVNRWSCSCKGYLYRRTCWAIEEIKKDPGAF
jgi:hypothetical protein